jgi:DNA-binding transcriptional regulator GbsR (MarR family)
MAARRQAPASTTGRPLDRAQDLTVETMGRMAEFWGFTRTQGRVFCLLFLSAKPMTQAELAEQLDVSAANVSMSLNGLLRWGAVHKVYEKGARKVLYEAEPELRKIIRSVLGGREQNELQDAVDAFAEAVDVVKSERGKRQLTPEEELVRERIQHLESVVRTSNRILSLLLGDGRVDVKRELGER